MMTIVKIIFIIRVYQTILYLSLFPEFLLRFQKSLSAYRFTDKLPRFSKLSQQNLEKIHQKVLSAKLILIITLLLYIRLTKLKINKKTLKNRMVRKRHPVFNIML